MKSVDEKKQITQDILDGKDFIFYLEQLVRVFKEVLELDENDVQEWTTNFSNGVTPQIEYYKKIIIEKLGEEFGKQIFTMIYPVSRHLKSKLLESEFKKAREAKFWAVTNSILKPTEGELKYSYQLILILTEGIDMGIEETQLMISSIFDDTDAYESDFEEHIRQLCQSETVYSKVYEFIKSVKSISLTCAQYLSFPNEEDAQIPTIEEEETLSIEQIHQHLSKSLDQRLALSQMEKTVIETPVLVDLDANGYVAQVVSPMTKNLYGSISDLDISKAQTEMRECFEVRMNTYKNPKIISAPMILFYGEDGIIKGMQLVSTDFLFGKRIV